jgi:hypothetical protein
VFTDGDHGMGQGSWVDAAGEAAGLGQRFDQGLDSGTGGFAMPSIDTAP